MQCHTPRALGFGQFITMATCCTVGHEESGGCMEDLTISALVQDAQSVLRWLDMQHDRQQTPAQPAVNPSAAARRHVLVGSSIGGLVAALVAAQVDVRDIS